MGLFGKNTQEKQFDQSLMDSAEKNDTTVAMQMRDVPNVGYDSQVSAMIISVDAKFLPLRFIPMLDNNKRVILDDNGQPKGQWVTDDKYNYQEPYGEEAVSFVEQEEERRLMNRIGGGINGAYTIGIKYKTPMTNTFNYFVRMRKDQLVNTRSTGRASKLAKSQIVDTSANIMRGMIPQKKHGGLLSIFGL
jgi:hypothetical protein